jgi:hypothetical protein
LGGVPAAGEDFSFNLRANSKFLARAAARGSEAAGEVSTAGATDLEAAVGVFGDCTISAFLDAAGL